MQIKFSTSLLLLWACAALPVAAADANDIKMQPSAPERYVVQKGDTLWSIARQLRLHDDPRPVVDELAAQVRGGSLQAGQRLVLP